MSTADSNSTAVFDPVCGMTISSAEAVGRVEYDRQIYFFCSNNCLEQFKANPETFVRPSANHHRSAAPAVSEGEYTCPMDPEVRQAGPGPCPKCGMALEPVMISHATKTEWTCPMHPEIVRDEPGSCPICGMALEPRTVTLEDTNPELDDMRRRFRVSLLFTGPILIFMISEFLPGQPLQHLFPARLLNWVELALATPVVLWGGWPFLVARGHPSSRAV